jgi:hypothetical protein
VNRLRSLLREFYPAALAPFPTLTHAAAITVLKAAPGPRQAAKLTPARMTALLRRARRRNDPGLAERLSTTLRQEHLRQPAQVEQALTTTSVACVRSIYV